ANKRQSLFSRDCLEVVLALNKSGSKTLTLFINHLKSKFSMSPAERQKADALRQRQAQRVREIAPEKIPGPKFNSELFAVIGDLNDEPLSAPCTAAHRRIRTNRRYSENTTARRSLDPLVSICKHSFAA